MAVDDQAMALEYLERIGYYRLSGYWYPCRERASICWLTDDSRRPERYREEAIATDHFKAGSNFNKFVELYAFDKVLRHLTLDALEQVEIALRVDISHGLGKVDTFAYANPECLHPKFTTNTNRQGVVFHNAWIAKHEQLVVRSKEEFVQHNRDRYGLPLAIWVACEVWDFGALSMLFGGMKDADQDAIARKYGVQNGRVFASWLRSLNYLRNVCAHHSRLWNRNVVDQPRLPRSSQLAWTAAYEGDGGAQRHARARCYLLLRITRHIMGVVNPGSNWPQRMKAHLDAFPDLSAVGIDMSAMGAMTGWEADW